MSKQPMSFVKGMGLGLAVGAAATFAVRMATKDDHSVAKGGAKAVRAVGDLVDGIQTMFR